MRNFGTGEGTTFSVRHHQFQIAGDKPSGFLGCRGNNASFGWISTAPDDQRNPDQFRMPFELHGGKKSIHVHVQEHAALAIRVCGKVHAKPVTPVPRPRPPARGRTLDVRQRRSADRVHVEPDAMQRRVVKQVAPVEQECRLHH
jgi:hypothetical protein